MQFLLIKKKIMEPKQIGLAFGLTIIAGLSTSIGSLIAFLSKKPNRKFLSFTLGLSAGVMIYISLAEMLMESIEILKPKYGDKSAYLYAILMFFAGIALILLIDRFVPEASNPHEVKEMKEVEETIKEETPINLDLDEAPINLDSEVLENKEEVPATCECITHVKDLSPFKRRRLAKLRKGELNPVDPEECVEFGDCQQTRVKKKALLRSGLFTALAIAIHNFPEGMATFVSGLQGLEVALPIVIAISLHNIPEGISVSVPLYYATGSKKKAFFWSALSGFAEPLGALFAYLILLPFFSVTLLGFLNAFVAGIMVFIALDELLPSAIQTGETHLPIYGVIVGMAVMAFSIYAFA